LEVGRAPTFSIYVGDWKCEFTFGPYLKFTFGIHLEGQTGASKEFVKYLGKGYTLTEAFFIGPVPFFVIFSVKPKVFGSVNAKLTVAVDITFTATADYPMTLTLKNFRATFTTPSCQPPSCLVFDIAYSGGLDGSVTAAIAAGVELTLSVNGASVTLTPYAQASVTLGISGKLAGTFKTLPVAEATITLQSTLGLYLSLELGGLAKKALDYIKSIGAQSLCEQVLKEIGANIPKGVQCLIQFAGGDLKTLCADLFDQLPNLPSGASFEKDWTIWEWKPVDKEWKWCNFKSCADAGSSKTATTGSAGYVAKQETTSFNWSPTSNTLDYATAMYKDLKTDANACRSACALSTECTFYSFESSTTNCYIFQTTSPNPTVVKSGTSNAIKGSYIGADPVSAADNGSASYGPYPAPAA
jgi:hypothetical protein